MSTPSVKGMRNTPDIKSLKASAMIYRLVVVRSRVFLQTAMHTIMLPVNVRTLKIMMEKTSTVVKSTLRLVKTSAILRYKKNQLSKLHFGCNSRLRDW